MSTETLKQGDAKGYDYKTSVADIIANAPLFDGRFYRELIDVVTSKCYGTQELTANEVKKEAQRFVGFYGGIQREFTAPFEVQRGHKIVTVKASYKNPIVCREHIYPHI